MTEEEIKKKEQTEALKELYDLQMEVKKERIKKISIFILCFAVILIIFKFAIGVINIQSFFPYNRNRWYNVELNNKPITIGAVEVKTTTIIPYVLNVVSASNNTFLNDKTHDTTVRMSKGKDISLSIESYDCFSKDNKVHLKCDNDEYKEVNKVITNDTKYELFIKTTNKVETVMYDGTFISNISTYFPKCGRYLVQINGKYKNVESSVYFWIEIIENNE